MQQIAYIDVNKLRGLGFNEQEIQQLNYVYNNGGKFTSQALQSYGYTFEQARRLIYMYNICIGKVSIDSKDQMSRHLKKTFGQSYKLTLQDLQVSTISNVPRYALVDNLNKEPYSIWNSKNYTGDRMLHIVSDVTPKTVTIETPIKPQLKYKDPKVIDGVLEIKGVVNGRAVVTFNKKYCRLCNRFIIIASFRNPEFHLGKYEVICFEGSKIYIYAMNMGIKEQLRYSSNQRIYSYGVYPKDIKPKLDKVAKGLYQHLKGVSAQYYSPNSNYRVLDLDKPTEPDYSGVEA